MSTSRSGAGGKIVNNRRHLRLSATPYDRPPPPVPSPAPPPSNRTNWFTGLIVPSAKALASGAGKIISTILSESESSSSEEDEDYILEDDDDNEVEYGNSHGGGSALQENRVTTSTMVQRGQESQLGVQRTETKHLIEQLIKKETFSREECDKLVKVINSRVIDVPLEAGENDLLDGSPGKAVDREDVDTCNKAVLEAKKWFLDKKVGSSSGTKLAPWSYNTNSTGLEDVSEYFTLFTKVEDGGSFPVDVARSYMKERPPWASPTKNIELRTPTTLREGTLTSAGHDSLSLSKKRNSLASGSWNIQEELRRVRSKATEDMLRTPPSKTNPLLVAAEPSQKDLSGPGKLVSAVVEKTTLPESCSNIKQTDALVDAGVSCDPAVAVLALSALESRQDGKICEAPSSKPAAPASGNDETSEAVLMDECGASKVSRPSSSTQAEEHHNVPQESKLNGSLATEVAKYGGTQNVNGALSSQESLSAGDGTGQNFEQEDKTNDQNGDSTNEKKSVNPTEAYVEVPIATENNSIASGSLDVQSEDITVDVSQPSKTQDTDTVAEKKPSRKSARVSRRGRGRGRGK